MSKILNALSKILVVLVALFAVLLSSCSFFKFKTSCDILNLPVYRDSNNSDVSLDSTYVNGEVIGELKIINNDGWGKKYISIKIPQNLNDSFSYTLPSEQGKANYVLTWQEGNLLQWKDINSAALGGTGELIQIVEKSDANSENPKQNTGSTDTSQTGGTATCTNLICNADRSKIALDSDVTGILSLKNGGIGTSLEDPGEDRILFWDESAGKVRWLKIGDNLDIDDRTLNAENSGGDGGEDPIVIVPPSTGYTGEIYTAGNGLYVSGSEVRFGGSLTENTTLSLGAYDMVYNLDGTGDFDVQNNGASAFLVNDSGYIGIGNTTPEYKLDVRGTVRADDFLTSSGYSLGSIFSEDRIGLGESANYVEKISGVVFDDVSSIVHTATTLQNGYVLIAYTYYGLNNDGLRFVIYDRDGQEVVSPTDVDISGSGEGLSSVLLPNGNVFISYNLYDDVLREYFTKFVIYDQNGVLVKSPTVVSEGYAEYISSSQFPGGNVIIFFSDSLDGYKGSYAVYDYSGGIVKAKTIFDSGDPYYFSSALLDNGNVVLAYMGSTGGLTVAAFNSIGEIVKSPTVLVEYLSPRPSVTQTKNGNIFVAYEDYNNDEGELIIIDSDFNIVKPPVVFANYDALEIKTSTILDNKVIMAYWTGWSRDTLEFKIFDDLGNELFTSGDVASDVWNISISVLDDNSILFAYQDCTFSIWGTAGAIFANSVGIGTETTNSRLEVVGSGSGASTSSLWIKNAIGTTGLYVNDLGYVGIGTTNPIYSLDVLGTIRAQDFFTSGGMPVNDILLEQEVRNLSITAMAGSLGLDVANFVEKNSENAFNGNPTAYDSSTTLTNGNVLTAYVEGSYGNFVIHDSEGNLVKEEVTFNIGSTSDVSITALSNGNVFIAYGDSGRGSFVIYDSLGNQVKSETAFSTSARRISTTTLTNGNVLIAYDNGYGTFVIYDSAGNIVKSETIFNSAGTGSISTTPLLNGNVLIVYQDWGNYGHGAFVIYNSLGNLVRSETLIELNDRRYYLSATTLNNGNFLIAYYKETSSYYSYFKIYNFSGNVVKTETLFNYGQARSISTTTLSNGNVLIAYQDVGNSNYGTFVIYDSGGNLVKEETIFNNSNTQYISTTPLTNGDAVISYGNKIAIYSSSGELVKTEEIFNAGTTNSVSATSLTNGNALIAYQDVDNSNYGNFIIYKPTGTLETNFNAGSTSNVSVATLTSGNTMIAYQDVSSSPNGNFVIYDSAGSSVISETTFNSGTTPSISSNALTNGNVFIAYQDGSDLDYGNFVIYDGAGNLIKSETTFNAGATSEVFSTTLTNGNTLIAYRDDGYSNYGLFAIYDSAGNLVKSETTFNAGITSGIYLNTLNNGNVFIAYTDESSSSYGNFVIYDSLGNLVKSETSFNIGATNSISATTLTNGSVLIAYQDTDSSGYGNFVMYDSSGNLVKSETTFNAGLTYDISVITLTNGDVFIAYDGRFAIWGSSGAAFANMVGIGTTDPTASLHVAGTLRFSNFGAGSLITDASGNVSVSSDERLKDVKGTFDKGLEEILQLDPILYKWNDSSGMETETTYAGLSAQNVQSVIPEAVGADPNGYLTLSDRPIIAATINAIKEQQLQIEELRNILIGKGEILESSQSSSSLDISTTDTGILAQIQTVYEEFKEMISTLGMTTHTDNLGNNYLSIDSDVKMAGNLNVLGDTTTSNLTATGNVQMGLITVNTEENSIDVLGVSCYNEGTGEESEYCSDTMKDPSLSTLYLQKSSSGNLNIFNGKLVIEPNGTTKLDGTLEVSGSVNSKSVDTETVSTEKIILKNFSNENSETPSGEEVPELQAEESLDLSEPCEKGEIKWDDNNIYVCTSSEKWRASPLNDIE